ncbi:MAG: hypothetical protein R3Y64_10385, partial [Peptostreptococcaceae bacterium]
MQNKNLFSNKAISNDEQYGMSSEILLTKINEDDVNNIAIMGSYGAGKSSLVKTMIQSFTFKYAQVSLAQFNSKDTVECNGKEIEKSILQQLFFIHSKSKFPESRLKRVGKSSWITFWKSVFIIFFLMSLICTHCILTTEDYNVFEIDFNWINVATISLTIILLLFLIWYLLKNFSIKKIITNNIELQLEEGNDNSYFNYFMDEIIYFFVRTKKKVIIFEDLDRFGNFSIFQKIREMNQIINTSKQIKNKVKFIYCIKDDMFVDFEERAKFFEFILTVPSQTNFSNTKDVIYKINTSLSENMHLPKSFIQNISKYIYDRRIINNIFNDYIIYFQMFIKQNYFNETLENNNSVKIFTLMVYKNLFPKEFSQLEKNNGIIVELFNSLEMMKMKEIEDKYNQNQMLYLEKTSLEKNFDGILNFNELKGKIYSLFLSDIEKERNSRGTNLNSLKLDSKFTHIYLHMNSNNYTLSKHDIEKELNISFENIYKENAEKIKNDIELIEQKIIHNESYIHKIKNMDINLFLLSVENANDYLNDIPPFVRMCLLNNYLTSDYSKYICYIGNELLTNNDLDIIKNIIEFNKCDYHKKIDNVAILVNEIDLIYFSKVSILYHSILEYFLTTEKKDEKYKLFMDGICNTSTEYDQFLSSFLSSNNCIDQLGDFYTPSSYLREYISFLIKNRKDILIKFLQTKDGENSVILNHLFVNYDTKIIIELNEGNCINNFLKKQKNILSIINLDEGILDEKVIEIYYVLNCFIDELDLTDGKYHKLEHLIKNNLFKPTSKNVFELLKLKYQDNNLYLNNISTIKDTIDLYTDDYFNLNFDEICVSTLPFLDTIDFDPHLDELLQKEFDIVFKINIIKKISEKIDVSTEYSKEVVIELANNNKINNTFSNLTKMHNLGISMHDVSKYILNIKSENIKNDCDLPDKLFLNILNFDYGENCLNNNLLLEISKNKDVEKTILLCNNNSNKIFLIKNCLNEFSEQIMKSNNDSNVLAQIINKFRRDCIKKVNEIDITFEKFKEIIMNDEVDNDFRKEI